MISKTSMKNYFEIKLLYKELIIEKEYAHGRSKIGPTRVYTIGQVSYMAA